MCFPSSCYGSTVTHPTTLIQIIPGKTVEFKYYVMDVIWKSLDEIVKICNYVMR